MASRTYDRTLECGCMYSADGGGGLMPCDYGYGCGKKVTRGAYTFKCGDESKSGKIQLCKECKEQPKKCEEAHKKWYKTKDYKKYCEEFMEDDLMSESYFERDCEVIIKW